MAIILKAPPSSRSPLSSLVIILFICLPYFASSASSGYNDSHHGGNFLRCLYRQKQTGGPSISKLVYAPYNSTYSSVLDLSIQNLRFLTPETPKPLFIVTPVAVSQAQAAVRCSRKSGLQLRIRSGGHDFEGLSYQPVSGNRPFVILDMLNLRRITVDVESATAWVESGATAGELYYRIAEKSNTLGFPNAAFLTVGVGGLFSGGGYGMMMRKYGLAADNIIDAQIIDSDGKLHDRKSMGEDLFWAIRGGGGNTFGVVVSWRIRLVPVPETVTVFTVLRTLEQNNTGLIHKWQYIAADHLPDELYMRVLMGSYNEAGGNRTLMSWFQALYLGRADDLLRTAATSFPELGLAREDCTEMSWVNSSLYFVRMAGQPLETLLNRSSNQKNYFKYKSDYVKEPIPGSTLEEMWRWMLRADQGELLLIFHPYGGRMSEISESAIPFPHRAGNLYKIEYITAWNNRSAEVEARRIGLMRRFYRFMAPYVSKSPRLAYANYRDLDLGTNKKSGNTSYHRASVWGRKYFNRNFDRLVKVKTAADPGNFFRNEQSIPPLTSW
ncbi:hypothetical protein SAY87_004671 [Trapa incisa]|uniref:FAD-binding PCMH-type domain-containing protein n=1 Tax=Trapa incisa TaxID=236973 RepID=A0AAN7PMV5_9MYRT|nr:hypothetical protein SAY87_004671 [Trapa incisa]